MPKTTLRRPAHLALLAGLLAASFAAAQPAPTPDAGASQPQEVAARVNGEPILRARVEQVIETMTRDKGEAADAQIAAAGGQAQARRIVLQRLIDLKLVVQKARSLGWAQAPEAGLPQAEYEARTARDYLGRLVAGVKPPTDAEIRAYYDRQPALFAKRRTYEFEELTLEVPAEEQAALQAEIRKTRTVDELKHLLARSGYIYKVQTHKRAAEQLPLAQLDQFHTMKAGHVTISPAPAGLRLLILTNAQARPVDLKTARAAIEAFLGNERRRSLVADDQRALRAAAQLEYVDAELAPASLPPASLP